jgi:3D (Asp-Asp-Asp) domain-containing protein
VSPVDRDPADRPIDLEALRLRYLRLIEAPRRPAPWGWLIVLAVLAAFVAFMVAGWYWTPPEVTGSLVVRLRAPRLPLVVDRTAYSLEVAQTDGDPFTGRCGRIAPAGVPVGAGRHMPAVAVSRDLLRLADCGARVRVDGRLFVVWDTMHERWVRRVDVLTAHRGEAVRLGRRPALFEVVR